MNRLRPHVLVAGLLFVLLVSAYLLMAVRYPLAYIWATYEDLFGEWGQTFFFASACVLSFRVALSRSRHRWFFVVLGLALFYTVMEEISWGQRIFGFETPEFFREHNLQRETNLHNMLVGPYSTDLKQAIEYAIASALFLFGVAYPVTLRLGWRPAVWFHEHGVASPPLYLWPYFLLAAWLELGPLSFNEAEVAELLVGSALAMMALHYWSIRGEPAAGHARLPQAGEGLSRRLALSFVALFLVVAGLSGLATYAMYQDDERRARIEARLLNGYEKFARRYERYERWDHAAALYLRVHEREPRRTYILRRLADAHRRMGDEAGFRRYADQALEIALERYRKRPDSVSNNLTLARTYDLLGDTERARRHGQMAHDIALRRAREKPDSASRAYWLGKTYQYLGNYQAALEQYRKAYRRKPSSSRYRRAYYRMRRALGS